MHSEEALHDAAIKSIFVCPVEQGSSDGGDPADLIGAAQNAITKLYAISLCLYSSPSHYQTWNIDEEFVRRSIRTFDETELAVVAEVDELSDLLSIELVRVVVDFVAIEVYEESWKGGTKVKAKAAGVADVVLPAELLV